MTIAVAGTYALVANYFPAMVGETESAAIALRTYNPQPAGSNKSRRQSSLGKNLSTPATQRQAAAVVCSRPNNMLAVIRAFEEAGVIFTEPTKTRGRGCASRNDLITEPVAWPLNYIGASGQRRRPRLPKCRGLSPAIRWRKADGPGAAKTVHGLLPCRQKGRISE